MEVVRLYPSAAEILGGLSFAPDLVEGQPEGHAIRTAKIACRIGREMGLSQSEIDDLYFASVLKDSGCSNNAVRVQKIFGGDEHLIKQAVKLVDWSSPIESLKFAFQVTEAGQSLGAKLRRMAMNVGTPKMVMNAVTEARCTRGAAIAQRLGLSDQVAEAIFCLDEHWDGQGAPYGKKKLEIPLLSRILSFAQTFEVFLIGFGIESAYTMAKDRKKKWFDPSVVDASFAFKDDREFFDRLHVNDLVETEFPHLGNPAMETDLDAICEVFAMIVDAKSSFTASHSDRVMEYSVAVANALGMRPSDVRTIRRGALIHDIGKLGVPSGILEKPGKLDDAEFDRIKLHPMYADRILNSIPGFSRLAEIGSSHHERLDGKGYWKGLSGDQISLPVRIVTVSDVFDALTANRPYRDAMQIERAFQILHEGEGTAFDPECVRALKFSVESHSLAA